MWGDVDTVTTGPNSPVTVNTPPQLCGLPQGQLVVLSERLAKHATDEVKRVLITCVLGDPESAKFASDLVLAFRNAGWSLPGTGLAQAVFASPISGIRVQLAAKDANPPGLSDLVVTLREAGIEPVGEVMSSVNPNEFKILVGSRPVS